MSEDSGASRQSGITGLIAAVPGAPGGTKTHIFSEIAFPPFGYVLAINTPPADKGLLDITAFTRLGYRDFRSLYLPMPVRSVNSYFPADFRSRQEWEDALDA